MIKRAHTSPTDPASLAALSRGNGLGRQGKPQPGLVRGCQESGISSCNHVILQNMRAVCLLIACLSWVRLAAQGPDPQQIFQEAAQAQQRGDFALAASKYLDVIRLDPNVVAAHANLGVVLVSLGRFDEGIAEYQIALSEAPGSSPLLLNLGLAYYKKGDFSGAAAEFASLHKEDPGNLRVVTLLANCQVQVGLVGQALALLKPLAEDNPDNLDLEWAFGNALIRAGESPEGLKRIQKVAERGHNLEAYQLAADLALGLAQYDQAREQAKTAIQMNPDLARPHLVLAMMDDFAGNEKGAEIEYHKALEIDPKVFQARIQLANTSPIDRQVEKALQTVDGYRSLQASSQLHNEQVLRYHEALVLARLGRFQDALQAFAWFASKKISAPELIEQIGRVGLRRTVPPKYIREKDKSLFMAAGSAAFRYMAGQESEARELFHKLFQQFPNAPNAHLLYGHLLYGRESELAIQEFQQELKIAPSNADANMMLAWAYLMQNDPSAALSYAKKAEQEAPELPVSQLVLGRSLVETGDAENGTHYLEKAAQLDPGNPEIHIGLAQAYSETGRKEDARHERMESLRLTTPAALPVANP